MSMLWLHLLVSITIAVAFGVAIDVDHSGSIRDKIVCALSWRVDDCVYVGGRGIFHSIYFWSLLTLAWVTLTVHIFILDGGV